MKLFNLFIFILFSITSYSQEWEQVASIPDGFGTDHSFAFSIDGTGYVVAGTTATGYSSSFYSYDAATDEWTKKEDFPGSARGFAIGEVWGDKAYFGFGRSNEGLLDDFWEYDPSQDTWTQLAGCECDPRSHPAMVALNGEIYVGLGGTPTGNTNDWWVYSIEFNAWTERTAFPDEPRHHPYQFTDGQYIYTGFGHGSGFISNQWYRYNPLDDTWLEVATLPAEGRVAGTQMSYNGIGLILSGDGDDHGVMDSGEFWMYDAASDTWTALTSHPGVSRWAPASFIIDDEIYLINGERSGIYLTENYKFDLSGLNSPQLNLNRSDDNVVFATTDDYCDKVYTEVFQVKTRIPFDFDVELSVEVDPTSTAFEGQDYILGENVLTLNQGEKVQDFEVVFLDDAIVKGERTLILNLEADANTGVDRIEYTLEDDDIEFGTVSVTRTLNVGEGADQSPAPFSRYYTNAKSQLLYRSEMLNQAGLGAGSLDRIAFDAVAVGGLGYADFSVSIAHTEVDEFSGVTISGLNPEQVFKGLYTPVEGINEIVFDTPFEYDGVSNLIIEICFDNDEYTVDDFVASTDVGYNSVVTILIDNVTGCPSSGDMRSSNVLPNLLIKKDGYYPLYSNVGERFQSSIDQDETAYFVQNDSIHSIVDHVSGEGSACFTSELVIANNVISTNEAYEWVDRIYYVESADAVVNDYELTLVVPNNPDIDWSSENVTVLYSVDNPTMVTNPEWTSIDPISTIPNEEYVTITLPYQDSGYYALGKVNENTSTLDDISSLEFDNVTIFDLMGRKLYSAKNDNSIGILNSGIYLKTYSYKGEIIRTVKIYK